MEILRVHLHCVWGLFVTAFQRGKEFTMLKRIGLAVLLVAFLAGSVCLLTLQRGSPRVRTGAKPEFRLQSPYTQPVTGTAERSMASRHVDDAVFEKFSDWAERYQTAGAKNALLAEGVKLAQTRRTELLRVIQTDQIGRAHV
jgi:hypothetical protein